MKFKLVFLLLLGPALAFAQEKEATVIPGENLVTVNIPAISKDLASSVRKYTEARSASIAAVHPDGKSIVISTRFANTAQLHLLQQPMGARSQLTFFEEPVSSASFEPVNGKYLIYSRDSGGNEFGQLYRLDLSSFESTLLTDGGRSQNGSVTWKKDGSGFYFTSTKRNGGDRDIYFMDMAAIPASRLICQVKGGGWAISDIAPDGGKLLIQEYVSANESHVWLLDTASGQMSPVTNRKDKGIVQLSAKFTDDPDKIWLVTDKDSEFRRLSLFDLKSRKHDYRTTSINWDVEHFELSPDKSTIAFVSNEGGSEHLYLMSASETVFREVPDIPLGLFSGLTFSDDGKSVFYSHSTGKTASDVYRLDLNSLATEPWTRSELGGISEKDITAPKAIEWTSFDKRKISGFYYPAAAKFSGKRPVVILIHGGPEGQSMASFLGSNNYFTNEMGVALLFPNVRGSSGFGKTFLRLDNGYKREDSVKDIGALLDWIAAQPELDKDRVMIMGGSYGGYMTLATAFHYSDQIRCSVDIVGISNFNTFLKNTEEYRRDLRRVEYGDERDPKMAAFFEKIAPLNNIGKIGKPLFIIQGTNDPRVPVSEAVQMRDKLQAEGKTVWYLEALDEGHGFRKKSNVDYQRLATILFMQQYLIR